MFAVAMFVPSALSLFLIPLDFWTLFGLFLVAGLSISLISPLGHAGIMGWFGNRDRGLAFGLKQMGVPLGSAAGALVLPLIALRSGWQTAFVVVGIFVGLSTAIAGLIYRDPPEQSGGSSSEGSRPSGPAQQTGAPSPTRTGGTSDVDGSAASAPEPEPALGAARPTATQQFLLPGMPSLILMGLTFAAVQMTFLTFLTSFLIDIGVDLITAAVYLSLSQLAGMAGRPVVGIISDRWLGGRRKAILLVIAGAIVSSVAAMATFAGALGPTGLAISITLVGLCSMAWAGLFFAAVLERADPRGLGSASGLASTANMSGSLVGAPVFGFISDVAGFRVAYWTFAAILGLVAVLFARNFDEGATREP
jgi:MFS family permease